MVGNKKVVNLCQKKSHNFLGRREFRINFRYDKIDPRKRIFNEKDEFSAFFGHFAPANWQRKRKRNFFRRAS